MENIKLGRKSYLLNPVQDAKGKDVKEETKGSGKKDKEETRGGTKGKGGKNIISLCVWMNIEILFFNFEINF